MFNAIKKRMKQIREQMERERKSDTTQGIGRAVEATPVEGTQRTKRQERRKMFQEILQ